MKDKAYRFLCKERKKFELIWDKIAYYDLETAPWDCDFKNADDDFGKFLNIKECGVRGFCFLAPLVWFSKTQIKKLLALMDVDVLNFYGADFLGLNYYDDNPQKATLLLRQLVDEIIFPKQRQAKRYVCGFNNSKFDDLIFAQNLTTSIWGSGYRRAEDITENLKTRVVKNQEKFKLEFLDLRGWANAYGLRSLKKLGAYLGLEKKEEWTSIAEYKEYNLRDVEILVHFAKHLNDHGCFRPRPASSSRDWVSANMKKKLDVDFIYTPSEADQWNLFGGRTEPYFSRAKNIFYLDFNSLYPATQVHFKFPAIVKMQGIKDKKQAARVAGSLCSTNSYSVVVRFLTESLQKCRDEIFSLAKCCQPFTPENMRTLYEKYFPTLFLVKVKNLRFREDVPTEIVKNILFYFPFPRKTKGFTLFSHDQEAEYEVQFYEVLFLCFFDFEITRLYQFAGMEPYPLANEIQELYLERKKLKAAKDPAERKVKIILNSGYGILATLNKNSRPVTDQMELESLREIWAEVGKPDLITVFDHDTEKIRKIQQIGNGRGFRIEEENDQKYTQNTLPFHASAITSHARFCMYSTFLNRIMYDIGEIYYCDTDSILCDKLVHDILVGANLVGNELGQMKLEKTCQEGYFLAPKSYAVMTDTGWERTMKGIGPAGYTRRIVSQSLRQNFTVFDRHALNPAQPQKRKLINRLFLPTANPEQGTEELEQLYQAVQETCK